LLEASHRSLRQAQLIPQEEVLFKWDTTEYPIVENIQTSIEPFQKLYNLVLRWQRSEKRWMDGEFLKLESEAIEAEVDEFWREIYKCKTTCARARFGIWRLLPLPWCLF